MSVDPVDANLKHVIDELADSLSSLLGDPQRAETLLDKIRHEVIKLDGKFADLQEEKDRYQSFFNQLNRGVVIYKVQGDGEEFQFTDLNPAAEQISDYRREELLGKSVMELFPTIEGAGLLDAFQRVWASDQPEYQPVFAFQEGDYSGWIESYVLKLATNEIVAIFDDVTVRQEAEDQLKRQNELLERIIEALDYPFLVVNTTNYQIEMANSAARNLNQESEISTCYALTHHGEHPCSAPDHQCPLEIVVKTKKPVVIEHKHFDQNGKLLPVEVHGYPLFDDRGDVTSIIEYTLDLTHRKEAEKAAREKAAAAERERLAQDLHDAVSQTLFSASLVARLLPELMRNNPGAVEQNLIKLQQLIDAATAEMRSLLLELRPGELAENNLTFLLRHLSQTLTDRAGIPVIEKLDEGCNPPQEIKITLYRIAQEAFNNAAKHAQANEASLGLACNDGRIDLHITDDGRGFDPDSIPPGHYGLRIMQERAESIGAAISLSSSPGNGTQIKVVWDKNGRTKSEDLV